MKEVSSKRTFKITISDSYVTYEYDLPLSALHSISSIITVIFKLFNLPITNGRRIS